MEDRDRSGTAVGFTLFAAMMMIIIGSFHAIAGLAGIIENEFFLQTPNYVFEFDATAWGFAHLIVGVIVLLAGFGLFSGATWARTVGVFMATFSAIANFFFLPLYPIGAIVTIAVDIMVIWALTAHGRDIVDRR